MKTMSFLIGVCLLLLSQFARATTYYVSNEGASFNDGLSPQMAFDSISTAIDNVFPGDTILVLEGIYPGFDMRISGFPGSPILFLAENSNTRISGDGPITPDAINIEGADYIIIDGFNVLNGTRAGIRVVESDFCIIRNSFCHDNGKWGIFTVFANDILIKNNRCYNNTEDGIYFSNSADRPVIVNNFVYNNNQSGIQINADSLGIEPDADGVTTDAVIANNMLYGNGLGGGGAINLDGAVNATVYNNLIYDNHATGIALFRQDADSASVNAHIYHNTIVNATDATGWNLLISDGSTGADVQNNILVTLHETRGVIGIDTPSLTDFKSDYNILTPRLGNNGDDIGAIKNLSEWQALGFDLHSQGILDLSLVFEDVGGDDYHLVDWSLAVDTAIDLGLPFLSNDLEGNMRPQGEGPDVGAYESSGLVPIQYLNLQASSEAEGIKIEWLSIGEVNVNNYVLQRSFDGITFQEITLVTAKNENRNNYAYIDLDPHRSGENYYRLKVIEQDGDSWHSSVVNVRLANDQPIIRYDGEFISIINSEVFFESEVLLIDALGKVIFRGQMQKRMQIKKPLGWGPCFLVIQGRQRYVKKIW